MAGMVLQHSWLCWWPFDEQCIISQHCIAASGVDMAKQSEAYVAKATAITANKIGLAKRICTKVGASQTEVKADGTIRMRDEIALA